MEVRVQIMATSLNIKSLYVFKDVSIRAKIREPSKTLRLNHATPLQRYKEALLEKGSREIMRFQNAI